MTFFVVEKTKDKVQTDMANSVVAEAERLYAANECNELYTYLKQYKVRRSHSIKKIEFNPFPHMTILQQTTLNIFCQKIENLYN